MSSNPSTSTTTRKSSCKRKREKDDNDTGPNKKDNSSQQCHQCIPMSASDDKCQQMYDRVYDICDYDTLKRYSKIFRHDNCIICWTKMFRDYMMPLYVVTAKDIPHNVKPDMVFTQTGEKYWMVFMHRGNSRFILVDQHYMARLFPFFGNNTAMRQKAMNMFDDVKTIITTRPSCYVPKDPTIYNGLIELGIVSQTVTSLAVTAKRRGRSKLKYHQRNALTDANTQLLAYYHPDITVGKCAICERVNTMYLKTDKTKLYCKCIHCDDWKHWIKYPNNKLVFFPWMKKKSN